MDILEWFKKEFLREWKYYVDSLVKRKKVLIMLGVLFVIGFFLGSYDKALLIIPMLTILASFSMIYNLFIRVSLGVELVIMATVLCALVYGPVVGIVVGVVSLFFAEVISTKLSYNTFISFIGIVIVGFVASLYSGSNIAMWGIAMTILYDIIIIPIYLLTGSNPTSSFIYVVTHIPWNVWVFLFIAPRIYQVMI